MSLCAGFVESKLTSVPPAVVPALPVAPTLTTTESIVGKLTSPAWNQFNALIFDKSKSAGV